jgi:A/G-specific adenine glycosylase
LHRLPGVGRYTAGAIASIAYGERAALVDGNVARVFARVFNIGANVKLPATQQRLWALAEALLPGRGCGEFNQALMELGALLCLPANPRCEICPLQRVCKAPGDALPNRGPRQRMQHVTQDVVWMVRDRKVRLRRRPATGLLAGMWELPSRDGDSGRLLLTVRHTIINRRITLRVFEGETSAGRWKTPRSLPMPAAHRRAVTALLSAQ